MSELQRRRAVITGRVQGVGFRWSAAARAAADGVAGWVVNRADGSVELEVEGSAEAIDSFLRWAADGPSGAAVAQISISDVEPEGADGFRIR